MSYYLLCGDDVFSLTLDKEAEEKWPTPIYGPFETLAAARLERAHIERPATDGYKWPLCTKPHYIVQSREEI